MKFLIIVKIIKFKQNLMYWENSYKIPLKLACLEVLTLTFAAKTASKWDNFEGILHGFVHGTSGGVLLYGRIQKTWNRFF